MDYSKVYNDIDKISDIARGFMKSEIFFAANELSLFEIIGEEGKNISHIVKESGADRRAIEIILNSLVVMELLDKKEDFYENTFLAKEYLITGKEFYQGQMLKHLYKVRSRWSELLDVVKKGEPAATSGEKRERSEDETRRFILGMSNIGILSVKKLIPLIDLSDRKHFLDLGGGPGTYSIELCGKYPWLKATVFDLPTVTPITKEQIEKAELQSRIDTIDGDFLADDYGGPYDTVFISNIIHMLGKEDILLMFRKLAKALGKGGKIIVKDFFIREDRKGPEFSVLFAVNMLVSTKEGNSYTQKEVTDLLVEAGFKNLEFKDLTSHTKIVTGVKE